MNIERLDRLSGERLLFCQFNSIRGFEIVGGAGGGGGVGGGGQGNL